MTPKQEDVLYREFKAARYYNTGEFTAFRLAIRAAVAHERERCARVCEDLLRGEFDGIGNLVATKIRRGE